MSPPIARVTAIHPNGPLHCIVEISCPLCGKTHTHGWPRDGHAPGHRVAHCGIHPWLTDGGYVIETPKGYNGERNWRTSERPAPPKPLDCAGCGKRIGERAHHYLILEGPPRVICRPCHHGEFIFSRRALALHAKLFADCRREDCWVGLHDEVNVTRFVARSYVERVCIIELPVTV
jgi:hypothetical protein